MLSAYQLDRARRNLSGYAVLGVRSLSLGGLQVQPAPGGDCGCGCRRSCNPQSLGLGALTPAQAVQQAVSAESNINPKDAAGFLSPDWTGWPGILQSGQISASAYSANCAGMPAPNINLFQTVSGLALGTSSAGIGIAAATTAISATTAALAGAVTMGIGAIIGVIAVIFEHHAAMVKQEQQLGCAAIAAWDNSMSLIDQAMQNGQITPEAASAGMDALYSKISSYLAPAVSHSPYCSAACELLIEAHAIAIYRKSVYADMASAVSAPATASTPAQPGSGSAGAGPATVPAVSSGSTLTIPPAAAPSASSPNWLMIALLLGGGFVLARAF